MTDPVTHMPIDTLHGLLFKSLVWVVGLLLIFGVGLPRETCCDRQSMQSSTFWPTHVSSPRRSDASPGTMRPSGPNSGTEPDAIARRLASNPWWNTHGRPTQ
jgi:hypothetical protein